MPRSDQLASLISHPPRIIRGRINPQDWKNHLTSLTNLDLRSGCTAFNVGTGYFIGFDSDGNPCFFIGEAGGKNIRYTATDGNLYIDKGALVIDGEEVMTLAYGIQNGTAYDADVVTFDPPFENVPAVIFGDGGITYSSTLGAVSTQRIIQALNITESGFTMKAKLGDLGAPTARSFSFSGPGGNDDLAIKTLAAEAYDDAYVVNFEMLLEPGDTGITEIYTRPSGGTFTLRATLTRTNGSAAARTYTLSPTITVDGLGANAEVYIVETAAATITGSTVDYSENTITEVTATPSGSTGISWLAIGGT